MKYLPNIGLVPQLFKGKFEKQNACWKKNGTFF